VTEFFEGCEVASVRIIEDREMMRPKGFGYVEFATADGLRKALDLDGQSFQSRMIKIKVADPRMLPQLPPLSTSTYFYRSSWWRRCPPRWP
jgi:RNA recognition motif-containing protein